MLLPTGYLRREEYGELLVKSYFKKEEENVCKWIITEDECWLEAIVDILAKNMAFMSPF